VARTTRSARVQSSSGEAKIGYKTRILCELAAHQVTVRLALLRTFQGRLDSVQSSAARLATRLEMLFAA